MDRKFKKEVQWACNFLRETGMKCLQERQAAMARGDVVPEDILTYVVRTKGKHCFLWRIRYGSCQSFGQNNLAFTLDLPFSRFL